MADTDGRNGRRKSVYVQQNKAYQVLLAILVVAFIAISAAVAATSLFSSGKWSESALVKMILQRRSN